MQAVHSLQNWIKSNTLIKAEDVLIEALPNSTYLVSGDFATGQLKMFVGFIERCEDASLYAQIIYKWAESLGRPLRDEIKFEALRIDNKTWDYYFWFDWMDKTSLGADGEPAAVCPIPTDPAQADTPPDAMIINDETINTNVITVEGESLQVNGQYLTFQQNP